MRHREIVGDGRERERERDRQKQRKTTFSKIRKDVQLVTALTINSAYIHLINKVEVVDIYLYCVFIRIAQINRLRVVSIHESNQAFNKIIYILERTGLFTRTVYGDILALKGLLVEQRNKNQKKQSVRIKSSKIRSNQVN